MRIFVGIGLEEIQRTQLAKLDHNIKGARWIVPENLHVTMRFIGEVSEDAAREVEQVLSSVRAAPFVITLRGLGVFPKRGQPRILWTSVHDEPEGSLQNLFAQVNGALSRAGVPLENRDYVPHITLARLKHVSHGKMAAYITSNESIDPSPFTADWFTLYQSHLTDHGAIYETLVEYSLVG